MDDWYNLQKNPPLPVTTSIRYELEQCTQEHFGQRKQEIDYFDSWYGFSLVCFKKKDMDEIMLQGEPASMVAKTFSFMVDRCKNNCK